MRFETITDEQFWARKRALQAQPTTQKPYAEHCRRRERCWSPSRMLSGAVPQWPQDPFAECAVSLSDLPKLALSHAEVAEILRAGGRNAILVGGQALAIWASFYQVVIPAVLTDNVTRDADFIGSVTRHSSSRAALATKIGSSSR